MQPTRLISCCAMKPQRIWKMLQAVALAASVTFAVAASQPATAQGMAGMYGMPGMTGMYGMPGMTGMYGMPGMTGYGTYYGVPTLYGTGMGGMASMQGWAPFR